VVNAAALGDVDAESQVSHSGESKNVEFALAGTSLPQPHELPIDGPVEMLDVFAEATAGVGSAIDAHAENPTYRDGSVWHHGTFMLTDVALRLDIVRLAILQWPATGLSRLTKLHDPQYSGHSRFLAVGPAGSSGHMILEYTAGSALETIRTLTDRRPATHGPSRWAMRTTQPSQPVVPCASRVDSGLANTDFV